MYLLNQLRHVYRDDILTTDNSSLCIWEECNRKFLYRVLLNLRDPEEKLAISFGKAMHSFLEFYYGGFDFETSFGAFVKTATRDNTKIQIRRVDSVNASQMMEYSVEFGYVLCKKYVESHPLDREYFEVLKDSDGKPYTETGFAIDLPNGIIIGLIDLMCRTRYNNRKVISDHKTTKHNLNATWLSQFNPNNQVSTYLYAASDYMGEPVTTAIINAIRVKDYSRGDVEENDKRLFHRIETTRTMAQLEQRMRHANFQLGQIQQSIAAGVDGFPMHTQSCNTKYGDCEYRRLCESQDDRMLQLMAETTFKVEKWVPYEVLEDSNTEKVITIDVNLEDHMKDKVDVIEKIKYIQAGV
jgi:hypothetical protein